MKKIFILGSGGFAKEVYFLLSDIGGYTFGGFIDISDRSDIQIDGTTLKVYSEAYLEQLPERPMLAMGVGDPLLIRKLAAKFGAEYEFPNLVHPSAKGHFTAISLGKGNVITANCVFTIDIRIGSFNIFNLASTVGHDVIIGDFNVVNPAVNISGGVEIGSGNLIGVNATILQYKKVGSGSVVGASSLVTKDVEDRVLVIGVPAVKVKNI